MKLNYTKAFVTGGAGFIGSHLVEALVRQGVQVIVLDNLSTGQLSNIEQNMDKITFIEGDVRNHDLMVKSSAGCDVIFHLAAIVSVQQTIDDPINSAQINEIGTLNLLEAARQNNIKRFVFSSSCAVYGDDPEVPKHEKMNPKPCSPYAVQKLTGEYYINTYQKLYDIKTVCLRYFNVYGPKQDPSSPYSGVISLFITKCLKGESPIIFGDGKQYRDFVYVADVVRANLLASMSINGGRVYNIGTGGYVHIEELWNKVRALHGKNINAEYQAARPGDILESVATIDRAMSEIDFAPEIKFEEGLFATYNWYKR
jgi:UDP-glucose 4-epimerase